jgi:hypothetical protein
MDCAANSPQNSRRFTVLAVALFVTLLALLPGYSETSASPDAAAVEVASAPAGNSNSIRPFSKIAIGISIGTLGPGVELATPVSSRTNLRVDGTFLNYTLPAISADGVNYGGNLKLRDARVSYDFFPFHGSFRLSAGAELYNNFNVGATGTVSNGQTVTFNSQDYTVTSPLTGTASLVYGNKIAPTFSLGWGNAIPRSHRHFAFPVEIGAIYRGTPTLNLAMNSGSACVAGSSTECGPVTSLAGFQTNLTAQKNKIINDYFSYARFYPILNAGVTYKF